MVPTRVLPAEQRRHWSRPSWWNTGNWIAVGVWEICLCHITAFILKRNAHEMSQIHVCMTQNVLKIKAVVFYVYTNNAQQALHSVSASFCWLYTDLMCWSLILAGWDQNGGKSRVNIRLEFLMWSETQTLIWCPLWMCKLDINMSASCSGFYLLPRV